MKKDLYSMMDDLTPEEITELLGDHTPFAEDTSLDVRAIRTRVHQKTQVTQGGVSLTKRRIAVLVACLVLTVLCVFGGVACAVEIKEYNDAVAFFEENGLSIDGLTRSEVKKVYRDIKTASFTYFKTGEVLKSNTVLNVVEGIDIIQQKSPEELAILSQAWQKRKDHLSQYRETVEENNWWTVIEGPNGEIYRYKSDDYFDSTLGKSRPFTHCILEKYVEDTLTFRVKITSIQIHKITVVSDGLLLIGWVPQKEDSEPEQLGVCKVGDNGQIEFQVMLPSEDSDQSAWLVDVWEDEEETYTIVSRVDSELLFTVLDPKGTEISHTTFDMQGSSLKCVSPSDDGYLMYFQKRPYIMVDPSHPDSHPSVSESELSGFIKIDTQGKVLSHFEVTSDTCHYEINDIIEYGGNVYLSVTEGSDLPDYDGYESILVYAINTFRDELDSSSIGYSNETLNGFFKSRHTAVLLRCDPDTGETHGFYSSAASFGGTLSVSDDGSLLWNVENILSVYYSPYTSSFTFGGSCLVYRYFIQPNGVIYQREVTGEFTTIRML